MRTASINERLKSLGGAKWEVHFQARAMIASGRDIIEMTIGEPDVPMPKDLQDTAISSLQSGRTGYSDGRGEVGLRVALAEAYTETRGRVFSSQNVLSFPGTQTALFAVILCLVEAGDEVLVGDPMYATYEGVVRAAGAEIVRVPMTADAGFQITADAIEARITERTRAILLNTPHNPTGAVLSEQTLREIASLALSHDLWVVSDEVYEHLVFDNNLFFSPLGIPEISDRVVAVSSISKSHAAPGVRSGWCIASEEFCDTLLPLAETMLFGNQPFIADMTERAVREGSSVAAQMRANYAGRAQRLMTRLTQATSLTVHPPQAGMFAMVDISSTGLDSEAYAKDLLEREGVAVMPGASFGAELWDWVRVSLTLPDPVFDQAIERIVDHANGLQGASKASV